QVLHRPAEGRRVDPEHGRALAHGWRQEVDLLVGLPALETIDEVQLGADAPDGPRLSGGDSPNDELGRPAQIGQVDDILVALWVYDDLDAGMLLAEVADVRRLEHLVHAAVPLPEQEAGLPDGLGGVPAIRQERVPDQHLFARDAHLVGRVAPEMLVREE